MDISMFSSNMSSNITSSISYSRKVIFTIMIILGIPSIICSIFLVVQFSQRPKLRQKPINFFIISLVIITFSQKIIEMPLTLYFLYENRVVHQSRWFCEVWNILQYSFGSSLVWLTMFCSIERYLFVFHSDFLKRHFILLRIIPLIWSLFHLFIIHVILLFLAPPCRSTFHYNHFLCGFPCYVFMDFWNIFGWNIHVGVPMFVMIISNCLLVGRVLIHKSILQQSGTWSKVVKLIIQIISIALLDLSAWIPMYITVQIREYSNPATFSHAYVHVFMEYFVYLPYLVINLCPFMCLIGFHELHKSLKQLLSKLFCSK